MSQMGGIQTGGGVFSRRQSSFCKHIATTTKSLILIQLLKYIFQYKSKTMRQTSASASLLLKLTFRARGPTEVLAPPAYVHSRIKLPKPPHEIPQRAPQLQRHTCVCM